MKFNLSGRLACAEYADHSDLDKIDQNYSGDLGFQQTPRLGFSLNASYLQDFRPDRDLFVNGLLFDTIRRDRWVMGGGASYALTERSQFALQYSFNQDRFPGGDFSDSEIHNILGSYAFHWTRRFAHNLSLGYNHAVYDASELDNVVLQLGISAGLSELWSVDLAVGGRHTRSEFDRNGYVWVNYPPFFELVRWTEKAKENGGVASFKLRYGSERTRLALSGGYDVQLASGRSGAVKQTFVNLELVRRFTGNLSAVYRAGYFLNRAEAEKLAEEEIDSRSYHLSVGLSWTLNVDWSASVDYQFVRVDNFVDETQADRQLAVLRLSYRMPLWN